MSRTWVVMEVAEALPVDDRAPRGPFYAPGSQWFSDPLRRATVEPEAAALRAKGFAVTVAEVVR